VNGSKLLGAASENFFFLSIGTFLYPLKMLRLSKFLRPRPGPSGPYGKGATARNVIQRLRTSSLLCSYRRAL